MVKVHQISLQGKRPSNEDEHIIFLNIYNHNKEYNKIDLLGVFDGHGGKLVSKFAKDSLPNFFTKKNHKLFIESRYTAKYIKKLFTNFNNLLELQHPRASSYSGSTCCITVLTTDEKKGKILWTINLGDSRAILSNQVGIAVPLTQDHKPNVPDERLRIEKLDGGKDKIYFDGSDWRVCDLSLSRALGDTEASPYVSVLPQVYRYRLSPSDNYIILACDGLWDVMSNQEAVDLIKNNKTGNLARILANKAIEIGSTDNVSVIVYDMRD